MSVYFKHVTIQNKNILKSQNAEISNIKIQHVCEDTTYGRLRSNEERSFHSKNQNRCFMINGSGSTQIYAFFYFFIFLSVTDKYLI